jgi:hypothetical protein
MEQKLSYLAIAFGSSPEHRVLGRVLIWLAIGDLFPLHHAMNKCFMPAAVVGSSLQLAASAKTMRAASHFNLTSQYKT